MIAYQNPTFETQIDKPIQEVKNAISIVLTEKKQNI